MNNAHLQVPFLSSLDRISFFRFLDAYDLYVAQATALNLAIPPRITFISPTVARIIGIRVDLNELDDADIFGRITDEFFRFNTQIEAHRALERLHLHTKTPIALLQHIAAFQRNLELCDDDTRPSAAQQRKLFVRSLPPLLQSRVKLMEPGSFDDACNHAITELDELIAAREQLGLQDNHATSAERATAAPAARRERPTAPHHGPVKCHGCGHEATCARTARTAAIPISSLRGCAATPSVLRRSRLRQRRSDPAISNLAISYLAISYLQIWSSPTLTQSTLTLPMPSHPHASKRLSVMTTRSPQSCSTQALRTTSSTQRRSRT
ncbi:hypothetical protein J8273_2249 [Carpediemonas membranifera]|uniref:Uncharacterized protein n=1 Tax=Carpediemonas membranifera TaxID=201153 RepID=A0A8J6BEQ5_9EUKA|nr:hypothetical protein J8273_2249 [Carpediemonas membranifera]|eukprot:KAG9395907.1 hypothetical protein J8273_2249 [Carpediemonas membranifera]